jgi:probable rRNA maturation factor
MNSVDVAYAVEGTETSEDSVEPSWLPAVEAFAQKVLSHQGLDSWDLSISFVDTATIRGLNSEWRKKDEPTDVLSFEQGDWFEDPARGRRFLAGDIVICLDSMRENAAYFGVTEDEELRRLVIHGILHLSGQDHADNSPEQPMLILQESVLKALVGEKIL